MAGVANMRPRMGPVAVVVVALAVGCGSRSAPPVASRLRVAAQPFALAEVARRVGGGRVVVAAQGEVVLGTGGDADPWLDPVAMEQVTQLAAATLSRADPAGRPSYEAAARAYQAQLGALDIDYRSSLADCARHDIVTADRAFVAMGTRYGFTDHAASDAGVEGVVTGKGIPVVFTEPGVATAPIDAVARAGHVKEERLDTLTGLAPDEVARGATYLSLMTDNLVKLRSALSCASGP
jgi:ABC-type Zn uptake system ZnuABC Zn-binding protein ZnuA